MSAAPTVHRAVTAGGGLAGGVLAAADEPGWAALAILVGVAVGVVPADVRDRRIPTSLVGIGAGATAVAAGITALRDGSWGPVVRVAIGAAVVGGAFLVVHLVQPGGLGFGDVRLATLAGALTAYGASSVTAAAVAAALGALAASIVTIVTRTKTAPFAPYLLVAAVISVAVSLGR
jgi:leader peptidase (prepilin peptidase)/N-methyltransferase